MAHYTAAMKPLSTEPRILEWPVEPGSRLTAPIEIYERGFDTAENPEATVVWVPGFGEGKLGAEAAGKQIHTESGYPTLVAVLPFSTVVAKASNLKNGLDSLVNDSIHAVSRTYGRGLPVYLGGNSRGGGVALAASATGQCDALGVLCPLGLTNDMLGKTSSERVKELCWRLGLTAKESPKDAPGRDVARGVGREVLGITLSSPRGLLRMNDTLNYALRDDLQTQTRDALVALQRSEVPVRIFGANRDSVFHFGEYQAVLGKIGCGNMLEEVDGFHACLAGRDGQRQLGVVAHWYGSLAVPPEIQPAPIAA